MPDILLKSRPLIGRELRMLASHWSRGPSENFQRGYPYDLQLGLYIGNGTSLEVIKSYCVWFEFLERCWHRLTIGSLYRGWYVSRGTQTIPPLRLSRNSNHTVYDLSSSRDADTVWQLGLYIGDSTSLEEQNHTTPTSLEVIKSYCVWFVSLESCRHRLTIGSLYRG